VEMSPDRQARIAQLRAGVASLSDSSERLSAALAASLPAEVPDPGIQIHYGPDGVVKAVHIDEDARAALTGSELLHKVTLALAAAPVPSIVTQRLLSDPDALRAIRERGAGTEPATYTSPDGGVTLTAVLGRPVEVRGTEGAILSSPTEDLSASIVALARKAAADEGMS